MTLLGRDPITFWNNLLDNLQQFVEGDMQNSNPSFAGRYSWECSCGSWGTARTEDQALKALEVHKELGKGDCRQYKLTKLEAE